MKKIFTIIIAVIMAIGIFGFSACDNSEEKVNGDIKGNYREVDANSYGEISERFEDTKIVRQNAVVFGFTFKSNTEIAATVNDKTVTLKDFEIIKSILDLTAEKDEKIVSGLFANKKLGLKADKDFGIELYNAMTSIPGIYPDSKGSLLLTSLDNAEINAEAKAYIKDAKAYVDANITGVPESIKALFREEFDFDGWAKGVKYVFDDENSDIEDLFDEFAEIKYAINRLKVSDKIRLTFDDINLYLTMFDVKFYADKSDNGVKVKLATTDTTKKKVLAILNSRLPKSTKEIVKNIDIPKLDIELYLALDNYNVITAAAGKVDIEVSANVYENDVGISINGAADLSLEIPDSIDYPSFDDYVSFNRT